MISTMTTRRHSVQRALRADTAFPIVKGRCRVCGKAVPPRRRTVCGEECEHRLRVLCWPTAQRHAVWRRDRGVCAACGFDTGRLERVIQRALWYSRGVRWLAEPFRLSRDVTQYTGSVEWQADHIVAVQDGGGVTADMTVAEFMANMQTLCEACHKAKSAEAARGLAREW